MASELRVDRIIPTSGVPTGGGGSIVQIVSFTKTDTASVTGPTFADVGLSVAITPRSSSNKILVLVQGNLGSSVGYSSKSRLMRGSTPIHLAILLVLDPKHPQKTPVPILLLLPLTMLTLLV